MTPAQTTTDPIIHKVRRRTTSRGRARGREAQRERRQMRAMPRMREVAVDEAMTSFGGVAGFATFCRERSIDKDIARAVAGLKVGPAIVYPLERVFAALVPMATLGMGRVFGFEQFAGDPLVEHVFGGEVPSIDTLCRDLRRVDGAALDALEAIANRLALQVFSTRHGGEALAPGAVVELDVDTSVLERYGTQEGAERGYDPRARGRRSHLPIACRVGGTQTLFGVRLRPGNEGFGVVDSDIIAEWVKVIRRENPGVQVLVRIDSGGDCGELLEALEDAGAMFLVKLRMTKALVGTLASVDAWDVVDRDADGEPTRRTAELTFRRDKWPDRPWRTVAVRDERESGKQRMLWEDSLDTARAYVTNAPIYTADELARLYDKRAGIEPVFADLKGHWTLGACAHDFDATEAWLLLKLIAQNALTFYAQTRYAPIARWATPSLRAALLQIPGRLVRSARQLTLKLALRPLLTGASEHASSTPLRE
jgi:hypothetical protein